MSSLSDVCKDNSNPSKLPLSQWSLDIFSKDQFLVFEGNIGVGKPHWLKKLLPIFKLEAYWRILVRIHTWKIFTLNLIVLLYPSKTIFWRIGFVNLKFFLNRSAAHKFAVADHSLFKSLVFAKINLSPLNFLDFKNNFERLARNWFFLKR